ncbi:MAG: hypothetical protein LBJ22_07895 [Synergistaceae bacterium]|nr:hypothetical protein [Synergistaceae bacterium]
MRRNWKIFLVSFLIVLTLAALADKAFATSPVFAALREERQYLSIKEDASQNKETDETFPESSRVIWGGRSPLALDEREICLSRKLVTERFLREKNIESLVVQQGFFADTNTSIRALLRFETDPPLILSLMTQIAVRK